MVGRLGGVFGWGALTLLIGGGVLALEPLAGLSSNRTNHPELAWPVGAAVLVALLTVFTLLLGAFNPEARSEEALDRRQLLFRATVAAGGLVLVWAVFPARHLDPEAGQRAARVLPGVPVELWAAVCLIALGLLLLLGASSALQIRRGRRALSGVAAGVVAVLLVVTLTPALPRQLLVEHTTAVAGLPPAPVPPDVTRVGSTWQPEQAVVGVGRGLLGPIVQYEDGFVGLDGETGEELWTYRQPYADEVETGFFEGHEDRAYFLVEEEPEDDEAGTRTLVLLDTATGEVVRESAMPDLGEHTFGSTLHLTPEARLLRTGGGERAMVVARAIDSDEFLWEFPLVEAAEGRIQITGGAGGYGDRLVVTRVVLDEEHLPEGDPDQALHDLRDMPVPDDALRTVIALDTVTGEELWRYEDTPASLRKSEAAQIREPRSGSARPVAATHRDMFDLDTGELLEALPEEPDDSDRSRDELLAADTDGTVVLRRYRDTEGSVLLRTAPDGGIVHSAEIGHEVTAQHVDHGFWSSDEDPAHILAEALLSLRSWRSSELEEGERAVLTLPLDEGADRSADGAPVGSPLEEGDLDWIRFDGERLSEKVEDGRDEARHRLLSVPGAVVSYVENPDRYDEPAPVHGLVP